MVQTIYVNAIDGDELKKGRQRRVEERVVKGVEYFLSNNPEARVILGGREELLKELITRGYDSRLTIAEGGKSNGHDLSEREGTAMYEGLRALRTGNCDAFLTIGNTQALVQFSQGVLKPFRGTYSMPLVARFPTSAVIKGGKNLEAKPIYVADVGASTVMKPRSLAGTALLLHAYCKGARGIENPKIGLLSNGHEEYKGTPTIRAVDKFLRENPVINFAGQVEPFDMLTGEVDAIVCDGFLGNMQLKQLEAFGIVGRETINGIFLKNWHRVLTTGIAALFAGGSLWEIAKRFKHSHYSGAALLCRGVVIKDHGTADNEDIANSLGKISDYLVTGMPEKIKEELERIQGLESFSEKFKTLNSEAEETLEERAGHIQT